MISLPVNTRVNTAQEVAEIIHAKRRLGLGGGILVTVPAPRKDALGRHVVEAAIQAALDDAASEGVHGGEVTPYLLARIAELTDGESVKANIALLCNNASVAADIAVALSGTQPRS